MKKFVGYHGTNRYNAADISENDFKIIDKEHAWLGKGVYFYDSSIEMAQSWAKYKYKKNKSVLECQIHVDKSEVFDVTDPLSEASKRFHIQKSTLALHPKFQNITNNTFNIK